MRQHYFAQLLAVFTALFFGVSSSSCDGDGYQSTPASPTSDSVTTTSFTTIYTTVTSTAISTVTKTRKQPCPPAETGVLDFDDLSTTGISPMPLIYQDFAFSGSAGWQYFVHTAYPTNSPEYLSVYSRPNALLSRSYGLVSFGSQGRGFSFDLTSVAFFAFTPEGTPESLLIEIELIRSDEHHEKLFFDIDNSGVNGGAPEVIDLTAVGDFKDLVDVSVAVWQSYDYSTGEGNPAPFVLDDIQYVKRRCSGY